MQQVEVLEVVELQQILSHNRELRAILRQLLHHKETMVVMVGAEPIHGLLAVAVVQVD
jgi:hypothetical protein